MRLFKGIGSTRSSRHLASFVMAFAALIGGAVAGAPLDAGSNQHASADGLVERSVTCSPLHVCEVRLNPGEALLANGIHGRDLEHWRVQPVWNPATKQTIVMVSPSEDAPRTNLLIHTDQRSYDVSLESMRLIAKSGAVLRADAGN